MKLQSLVLYAASLFLSSCTPVPTAQEQYQSLEETAGFKTIVVDGATADYLIKEQNGYKLLLRIKMGDVWGRYAARVTAGEVGRELGGIWSVLTGSYRSGVGGVTGSPIDRLLSRVIGQPISISVVMLHDKHNAPRADIVNMFSTIQPADPQPKIEYIGLRAGTLYSNDRGYAERVLADKTLIAKIENFRSAYVRIDGQGASFFFAGSENDYSGMIRDAGGYSKLLNDISDVLVGLVERIE